MLSMPGDLLFFSEEICFLISSKVKGVFILSFDISGSFTGIFVFGLGLASDLDLVSSLKWSNRLSCDISPVLVVFLSRLMIFQKALEFEFFKYFKWSLNSLSYLLFSFLSNCLCLFAYFLCSSLFKWLSGFGNDFFKVF